MWRLGLEINLIYITLTLVARPAKAQFGFEQAFDLSELPSASQDEVTEPAEIQSRFIPPEAPTEAPDNKTSTTDYLLANVTTNATTKAFNETYLTSTNASTGFPDGVESLFVVNSVNETNLTRLEGQSIKSPDLNTKVQIIDIHGTFLFINGTEINLTNLTNIADDETLENLEGTIYNATEFNISERFTNYYCRSEELELMPFEMDSSATEHIKWTLTLFTPVYIFSFFLFCIGRKHLPRYFNVRGWVPEMMCDIALKEYKGYFSWVWEVYKVSDDEILEQCGMDSLCFIRALRLGTKLAAFACFHSIYLLPLYATAPSNHYTSDPFSIITAGNVPNGSPILLATVLATYFVTFYTMHLFLKEFEWYTEYRHKLLLQRIPRNYAVYVSGIPEEFQTSFELGKYFEEATQGRCVLDSLITYDLPKLDVMVPRRDALVNAIDHFHAYERKYGVKMNRIQLRQLGITVGMPMVESVQDFEVEMRKLNTEICTKIDLIKERYRHVERAPGKRVLYSDSENEISSHFFTMREQSMVHHDKELSTIREFNSDLERIDSDVVESISAEVSPTSSKTTQSFRGKNGVSAAAKFLKTSVVNAPANLYSFAKTGLSEGQGVAKGLGTTFLDTASNLTNVKINFDGEARPRDAGFVVFKTLFNAQAAIQMIHHHTPHVMDVSRAPDPRDIVWKNVGLTESVRTLGRTLSAAATATLCVFWTPYSVFLTSLTQVDSLKQNIPGLKEATEGFPMLDEALAQVGPLLIIASRDLILPLILSYFVTWEGLISIPRQESSLFVKLAVFLLIQHFFVIAVSETVGVSSEIINLIENPGRLADLLGSHLPSQSSIFIQLIVMEATLIQAFELLRMSPLMQAFIRPKIGRSLTDKDRKSKTLFFVYPLENPPPFYASRRLASQSLFVMTFFVYTTIAPIVNFFLLLCSIIIETGYRYNFYHNYHATPDSGGRYWEQFIGLSLICMVIAQLALVGFLSLKRSAYALPFMIPLIVASLYYIRFLNMKHFDIATYLPTHKCLQTVRKNLKAIKNGELDMNFAVGMYLQPSLKNRTLYPEHYSAEESDCVSEGEVVFARSSSPDIAPSKTMSLCVSDYVPDSDLTDLSESVGQRTSTSTSEPYM